MAPVENQRGRVVEPIRLSSIDAGALAAFADRPDDQRLAAPHVAGGEQLGHAGLVVLRRWPRRCRAGRAPRPACSTMPGLRGPRKPMASSTRSALSSNSLPATSFMAMRPSAPFTQSTRTHSSAVDLAVLADARAWSAPRSRARQPSSCEDEVRILSGQSGQVSALFSLLRRLRHDLELGHRGGALAVARCRRSPSRCRRRRSPRHACPWRVSVPLGAARASSSPATRLFCWVRKSMAKWMPASSRPGTSRSRGYSAPPVSATRVVALEQRLDRERGADLDAGAEARRPRPPSARMRRSIRCFSILKSGMP